MRTLDMTILHALSTIVPEQANPTERTLKQAQQLLNYMYTNPTAVVCFCASNINMILYVHSNARYISTGKGQSHTGGYFFLESMPQNVEPIQLNGNIAITCAIPKPAEA